MLGINSAGWPYHFKKILFISIFSVMALLFRLRAWPRVAVLFTICSMLYAGKCQRAFDGSNTVLRMYTPSGDAGADQGSIPLECSNNLENWAKIRFNAALKEAERLAKALPGLGVKINALKSRIQALQAITETITQNLGEVDIWLNNYKEFLRSQQANMLPAAVTPLAIPHQQP